MPIVIGLVFCFALLSVFLTHNAFYGTFEDPFDDGTPQESLAGGIMFGILAITVKWWAPYALALLEHLF